MNPSEKPLFLFNDIELSTPPLSASTRREIGYLLGLLQDGETLGMPQARPMFGIAPRVYELRVREANTNWRLIYRADADRVLLVHQFAKQTEQTPQDVIRLCQTRLAQYDAARAAEKK